MSAHELDHIRQVLPPDPATHLESHRNNVSRDGADLDAATHVCLHSAGQYQPFFFNSFSQILDQIAIETLVVFISAIIPGTIPELPSVLLEALLKLNFNDVVCGLFSLIHSTAENRSIQT